MKQHTSSKIANRQGWLAVTLVMSVIITLVLLMSSCGPSPSARYASTPVEKYVIESITLVANAHDGSVSVLRVKRLSTSTIKVMKQYSPVYYEPGDTILLKSIDTIIR